MMKVVKRQLVKWLQKLKNISKKNRLILFFYIYSYEIFKDDGIGRG
jgi:hypothetical protein